MFTDDDDDSDVPKVDISRQFDKFEQEYSDSDDDIKNESEEERVTKA